MATAVMFKSESSDGYLLLCQTGINLDQVLKELTEQWWWEVEEGCLRIEEIASLDLDEKELQSKINEMLDTE